jgi:hypothetical protein
MVPYASEGDLVSIDGRWEMYRWYGSMMNNERMGGREIGLEH